MDVGAAAAGAVAGAGPVYAAGPDEGLGAFLIFPVRHLLQLRPMVGPSLLRRVHGGHQLPPAAASTGATALQQLLQSADSGCAGWRKQLSLFPPTSRSRRLQPPLPFLLVACGRGPLASL